MRRNARVTIEQLAQQLGVSKFSVSRALAGKDGVSDETRARVRRAAARLGYGGGTVVPPSSRQVLFVMQDRDPVSSELWIHMLHGAEREGARHGLAIVPRQARQLTDVSALDAAVVGLVLAVTQPEAFRKQAQQAGLPMVWGGYGDVLGRVDRVTGADWEGGVAVGRLLTKLGHRKIGFVRGEDGLFGRMERLRGLRDGASECAATEVREIAFDEPHGFRGAFTDLVHSGFAPTALFCAHDGLAITAISELLGFGLRVPDDVSIVGFNDFACATQIVPQLTTIRMPMEELGVALIRCLAARLSADTSHMPPLHVALAPELIERNSTAPAPLFEWTQRLMAAMAS
jgi:LacI family transcriptional regulator